ncbi:MAG: response regulator, partial [Bdellovibrionales bacterium]|nr:response regulator [Bdellovibrionales bacterium]
SGELSMIARYLRHIGFRVIGASTQIEAIEILRSSDIDVAVVGNNVADDPNEDLVGTIRSKAKSPSLPLILVSSRAFVFDIERYLKSGVDRCLIKPIELKELAYICRTLIDGTFTGDVLDSEEIELTKPKPQEKAKSKNERIHTKMINMRDIPH